MAFSKRLPWALVQSRYWWLLMVPFGLAGALVKSWTSGWITAVAVAPILILAVLVVDRRMKFVRDRESSS